MYACDYRTWRGFFEGVYAPGNASAYFRDPPPAIRELVAATVGRRKANGAVACALPRSPDHELTLGHHLVYVVVVAVLDARADPSGSRRPAAVADPALAEGGNAR